MTKTLSCILVFLLATLCAFGQTALPKYTVGAGLGFDTNAPIAATTTSKLPGWTQQINGWTSFGVQTDTKTYSYNTIHVVGNQWTLTPGILRVIYQSGPATVGALLDAGLVSSDAATGGTVQFGPTFFYDLGLNHPKLSGWYLTAVVKAQYVSVTPAPAGGYSIKPIFEFGLTYGLK